MITQVKLHKSVGSSIKYLHFYEGIVKQIIHFYGGIAKQIIHFYEGPLRCRDIPSIFSIQFITHTILDVVVDYEVEFYASKKLKRTSDRTGGVSAF